MSELTNVVACDLAPATPPATPAPTVDNAAEANRSRPARPPWSKFPAALQAMITNNIQSPVTVLSVMSTMGIRIDPGDTLESFKATLSPEPAPPEPWVAPRAPIVPPAVPDPAVTGGAAAGIVAAVIDDIQDYVPIVATLSGSQYGTVDVSRTLRLRDVTVQVPRDIVADGNDAVEEWIDEHINLEDLLEAGVVGEEEITRGGGTPDVNWDSASWDNYEVFFDAELTATGRAT